MTMQRQAKEADIPFFNDDGNSNESSNDSDDDSQSEEEAQDKEVTGKKE